LSYKIPAKIIKKAFSISICMKLSFLVRRQIIVSIADLPPEHAKNQKDTGC
jgi:hypothetical protein